MPSRERSCDDQQPATACSVFYARRSPARPLGETGCSGLTADACCLPNPACESEPSACRRRSVTDDSTQSIECGARRPIFVRRVYRLVSTRDGCANGVRDSLTQCGATLFSSAVQGSARSVWLLGSGSGIARSRCWLGARVRGPDSAFARLRIAVESDLPGRDRGRMAR